MTGVRKRVKRMTIEGEDDEEDEVVKGDNDEDSEVKDDDAEGEDVDDVSDNDYTDNGSNLVCY